MKKKINHSNKTILTHNDIYEGYRALNRETRAKYPEIYGAIARQYYYDTLSKQYKLTPNYICSIVNRGIRNEICNERALKNAKLEKNGINYKIIRR